MLTCLTYLRDSKQIKYGYLSLEPSLPVCLYGITFNPSVCCITGLVGIRLCNLLCIITALSKTGFHCIAHLGGNECEYWREDEKEMKFKFCTSVNGHNPGNPVFTMQNYEEIISENGK